MRNQDKALINSTNSEFDFKIHSQTLKKSYQEGMKRKRAFAKSQRLRTEFLSNQLINDHKLDINLIVETFLLLALFLFSALEEADWLCCSANMQCNDVVEDKSSWNIYQLFCLIPVVND